ncbi:hypothetical protein PCE1_004683 [Barthelona sp. PCE]
MDDSSNYNYDDYLDRFGVESIQTQSFYDAEDSNSHTFANDPWNMHDTSFTMSNVPNPLSENTHSLRESISYLGIQTHHSLRMQSFRDNFTLSSLLRPIKSAQQPIKCLSIDNTQIIPETVFENPLANEDFKSRVMVEGYSIPPMKLTEIQPDFFFNRSLFELLDEKTNKIPLLNVFHQFFSNYSAKITFFDILESILLEYSQKDLITSYKSELNFNGNLKFLLNTENPFNHGMQLFLNFFVNMQDTVLANNIASVKNQLAKRFTFIDQLFFKSTNFNPSFASFKYRALLDDHFYGIECQELTEYFNYNTTLKRKFLDFYFLLFLNFNAEEFISDFNHLNLNSLHCTLKIYERKVVKQIFKVFETVVLALDKKFINFTIIYNLLAVVLFNEGNFIGTFDGLIPELNLNQTVTSRQVLNNIINTYSEIVKSGAKTQRPNSQHTMYAALLFNIYLQSNFNQFSDKLDDVIGFTKNTRRNNRVSARIKLPSEDKRLFKSWMNAFDPPTRKTSRLVKTATATVQSDASPIEMSVVEELKSTFHSPSQTPLTSLESTQFASTNSPNKIDITELDFFAIDELPCTVVPVPSSTVSFRTVNDMNIPEMPSTSCAIRRPIFAPNVNSALVEMRQILDNNFSYTKVLSYEDFQRIFEDRPFFTRSMAEATKTTLNRTTRSDEELSTLLVADFLSRTLQTVDCDSILKYPTMERTMGDVIDSVYGENGTPVEKVMLAVFDAFSTSTTFNPGVRAFLSQIIHSTVLSDAERVLGINQSLVPNMKERCNVCMSIKMGESCGQCAHCSRHFCDVCAGGTSVLMSSVAKGDFTQKLVCTFCLDRIEAQFDIPTAKVTVLMDKQSPLSEIVAKARRIALSFCFIHHIGCKLVNDYYELLCSFLFPFMLTEPRISLHMMNYLSTGSNRAVMLDFLNALSENICDHIHACTNCINGTITCCSHRCIHVKHVNKKTELTRNINAIDVYYGTVGKCSRCHCLAHTTCLVRTHNQFFCLSCSESE